MQYREKQLVAPTFAEATAAVSELRRLLYTDEGVERWRRPLEIHAYPHLQDLRVDAIEPRHVIDLLRELRARSPKSVPRLGQQIAAVLSWAVAHGFRPDNPCDAALAAFSPPRRSETRPHPALPYADVPAAVAQLRIAPYRLGARLLVEFLILTVVRSDAARGALWSEVDLEAASWTVPATRMPNGAEHRIPLSSAALAVLGEARDDAGLSEALPSKSALSRMLHQMDIRHPLRFPCSFAEWAAASHGGKACLSLSGIPRDFPPRSLSHRVPVLEPCRPASRWFHCRLTRLRQLGMSFGDFRGFLTLAGWPRAVTHPRLPRFRACPIRAPGSSDDGLAAQRYTLCTTRAAGRG